MPEPAAAPESQAQENGQAAESGLLFAPDPPADLLTDPPEGAPADPPEGSEGAEGTGEVEEVELSTIDELSQWAAEVAPDADLSAETLLKLNVPLKVNGETSNVTIADLIENEQKRRGDESHLEDGKAKAKAMITEAAQHREEWQSNVAALGEMFKEVEAEIDRDTKSIDWNKLREDDPAEYSARKADVADRHDRIKQLKERATASIKKAASNAQQQQFQQLSTHIESERQKLVEAVPDFGDKDKGPELKGKLAKDLMSRGFSESEIGQVFDHRLVVMAHDAMLHREAAAKKETVARKKVVRVPKRTQSGSREGRNTNGAANQSDPWDLMFPATAVKKSTPAS